MNVRLNTCELSRKGSCLMLALWFAACTAQSQTPPPVLEESWTAYVRRFVQADGRVIDHKGGGISTSEGQAYAMLRAAWMRDRQVFDKAYSWGRNNLNARVRSDRLWAWKWGKSTSGRWEVLDRAFASDADQDVALALLLAHRIWGDERYLADARATIADLWRVGTIDVRGVRHLLAGDTLCNGAVCRVNPSYAAPYAYRAFAKIDRDRDWTALVDSSYLLLERASQLTATRLPSDWIVLDTRSGALQLSSEKDSAFSYDAFRVFWRVALDRELSGDARADRYLKTALPWLTRRWKDAGAIPAIVSATGTPLAKYESLEMMAALMAAWRSYEPEIAQASQRKLQATYKRGIWADQDSYYIQNWAWFGTALYERYLDPFSALK
jgi:endoglucanase